MKLLTEPNPKTPAPSTSLPDFLKGFVVPWTQPACVQLESGYILIQEINLRKFSLFIWVVQTKSPVELFIACGHPTIVLMSVGAQGIDSGLATSRLEKKHFRLLYIPESTHAAIFAAGISEILHFELRDGYLREISESYPEIRDILGRLKNGSKNGISLWSAPVDYRVEDILLNIRNSEETGMALCLEMQIFILQLLKAYIKKFKEQEIEKKAPAKRGLVFQVRDYIELEPNLRDQTIDKLCRKFHVSTTLLKKNFKTVCGMSIGAFVRLHVLTRAQLMLGSKALSIDVIADEVGYDYTNNFCRAFKRQFGFTPSDLRSRKK